MRGHIHFDSRLHTKITREDLETTYSNSSIIKRAKRGLEKTQAGRTLQLILENIQNGVTSKSLITELGYVTPAQGILNARNIIKNIGLIIVTETEYGPNRYGDAVSWYRYYLARKNTIQK